MNKYTFLWSNAHQLFYMRGNVDSYVRYRDIPFNRAEHIFQVSHGSVMTCYIGTADLQRHLQEGEHFLDAQWATQYLRDARTQCRRHLDYYKQLAAVDLVAQSNHQLLEWWHGLMDHYAHSVAYFRSTQEEPTRAIVNAVAAIVSTDDLNTLLLSPELDEINREGIAWEAVVQAGFTRDRAIVHIHAFPWLFQNVLDVDDTVRELEQRATVAATQDMRAHKEELRSQQQAVLARYPEVSAHVQLLQQLALLRPEVKAAWAATGYYATPLLAEVARRFLIDVRTLVFYYRHEDVEQLLEQGTVLTADEIAARTACTAYMIRDGKLYDYVGAAAIQQEQMELGVAEAPDTNQTVELKGIVARPGQVRGVVAVLPVNDPVAAMRFRQTFDGGVLVTAMTQPNIVDIAQRATAIVTDEGGMLSHAAIISREFGIPCIVGTHHATQVFKDGDEVEVDADKGVVRIVSRKT